MSEHVPILLCSREAASRRRGGSSSRTSTISFFPAIGLLLVWSSVGVGASPLRLDGPTAPRWQPAPGWVARPPAGSSVTDRGGSLLFRIRGRQTSLPWQITLVDSDGDADARYVVLRYRGVGLSSAPGDYFLHGWDGTAGGTTYAGREVVVSDGQWHTLAIDRVALHPLEPLRSLALKLSLGEKESAELEVRSIEITSTLPEGVAPLVAAGPANTPATRMKWSDFKGLAPAPDWVARAADQYQFTADPREATFRVHGADRGMRWVGPLPAPVDLRTNPYISFRYRLTGSALGSGYAFWLGSEKTGPDEKAVIPAYLKDLTADGAWHQRTVRLDAAFVAGRIAVGLDGLGESVELRLSSLVFGPRPPRWPVAELCPHSPMRERWPDGKNGFTCIPLGRQGASPAPFLAQRLGLEDWFAAREVLVDGVPFHVPAREEDLWHTGTAVKGDVALPLPPKGREICLLVAVAAPATEPFGLEPAEHPKLQERLAHAEKVVCEVEYTSGPPDLLMPVVASPAGYGLKRGIGVHVLHPDPGRTPRRLLVHDRMQTADVAVLGLTINEGRNRVAEPPPFTLPAPTPGGLRGAGSAVRRKSADAVIVGRGALEARFQTSRGLSWKSLSAVGLGARLSAAAGPVFKVTVGTTETDSTQWTTTAVEPAADGFRVTLKSPDGSLRAAVDLTAPAPVRNGGAAGGLVMNLHLRCLQGQGRPAAVVFPILDGVTLGSAADTWYYYGRRGGVIARDDAYYREPLGEPHPMQVDGFFGPTSGLALACLTHDTGLQHHFIRLSKGTAGGHWSIEHPTLQLVADRDWDATEAALSLDEGDWRGMIRAHQRWLSTWFRPRTNAPWFRNVFALIGTNYNHDLGMTPLERGDLWPPLENARRRLGHADYLHIFGWGASKKFGDWGDYNHYDELGGLDHFRKSVARVQDAGVPVGLYVDAFNHSSTATLAGSHAKEWAALQADGRPQAVPGFHAYTECLYLRPWQHHLASAVKRVRDDVGARAMYIDELGATDGRWNCHGGSVHGHPGEVIPYRGELALVGAIRKAVGPDLPLYIEYPPAEAMRQLLDGAFSYYAMWGQDQAAVAPHMANLSRFVFPEFKTFHILSYSIPRAGNWYHFKVPFFNGEGYFLGETSFAATDPECLAFLRKALAIQGAHRAAFAGRDVEPLAPTLQPGVFANRFSTPAETVWTLFNTTGRTVRGPAIDVTHVPGSSYHDVWNDRPISPQLHSGRARLEATLTPQSVGCVVQRLQP